MRTKLIIGSVIIVGALLISMSVWFVLKDEPEGEPDSPEITFPTASSTNSSEQGGTGTLGEDGIAVNDFINNGVTIEDPSNEGSYYLAGTSGYCYDDGTCASAGEDTGYNIVYYSTDESFAIALNREPLGELRREAERFLKETLGIDEQSMCDLRAYVGTTLYVSEVYGGIGNLGFSFCPGSVALP